MNTNKLSFKIPIRIISISATFVILVCIGLSIRLNNAQQETVNKEIINLAENNASLVSSYMNNMQTLSKSLAQEVARYQSYNPEIKDQLIQKALDDAVKDERIFSAYFAFEPNRMFENTPKGLSYYKFTSGNEKKLTIKNNFDHYSKGDYYTYSKDTLKPHITEPYEYQLVTGEKVFLITISNPILDKNDKFIGVATCEILSDTIQNLKFNLGGYQTSHQYVLSENAAYVANTADKTKAGTKYSENKDMFLAKKTLEIYGVKSKWNSVFEVTKNEAMKPSRMTTYLAILSGVLGVILCGIIVFYVVKKSLKHVENLISLSKDMGNGKLNSELTIHTKDEIGELAQISKNTSRELSAYINEISGILLKISNGDLKSEVVRDYAGDFAPIKIALTKILDSLNEAFSEIGSAAKQVSAGSDGIAGGAQTLSSGATEQAGTIEQLSASVSQISNQVKQNAVNANHAKSIAQDTEHELVVGKSIINEMMQAIETIKNTSFEITNIIKTIDEIAFQTNILALNAAVEAARAGSAGKGFAVVAEEVRNLAGKSAKAAKNTTSLIEDSINAIENGAKIAGETADILNKIVEKSSQVNHLVSQIADASNEQAISIEQIDTGVTQISSVVQTNSATAEENAAASEELSAQANLLLKKVAMFNLK